MSKSKRKLKRGSQPQAQPDSNSEVNIDQSVEEQPLADSEDSMPARSAPKAIPLAAKPGAKMKGKKGKEDNRVPINPDEPRKFKRPAWKHFVRYPAAFMLVVLNLAVFMSFIERLPRHQTMDPFKELFFFGTVGFIDFFMFMPMLFEVNRIETDKDGLKLSTLLWKTRLRWDQIGKFEQPKFLKFAILRTPKTFYLLNKYDLKPFFELAEIISAKMTATIQDRQA